MTRERRARLARAAASPVAVLLLALIRAYQLTLSAVLGRQCRYGPSCSAYAALAITRHGAWPGAWMGLARVCRCGPWGGAGFDPPPAAVPPSASWFAPWRYGAWRTPPARTISCEAVPPGTDA